MFQYTTETIINSNVGNLLNGTDEGVRFGIYSHEANADATLVKPMTSGATENDYLLIDGVNTFVLKNIKAIYHSPYRAAAKATATINKEYVTVAKDDIVRFTITLSEIGNVRSTIQNAYLHHTKPFHYEVISKDANAKTLLTTLANLINKDMRDTDFDYFKAKYDTTNDKLVLTADDCYIQFDSVELVKVLDPADGVSSFGGYARELTASLLAEGVEVAITPGDQGAGTVARLVKDLRIPTGASINPFGADQGGRPVPGGKYDQYLIEYETERRHVAGTVVGSVDRSLTSHVFFVESALVGTSDNKGDWANLMDAVATAITGVTISEAGRAGAATEEVEVAGGVDEVTMTHKPESGSVQ